MHGIGIEMTKLVEVLSESTASYDRGDKFKYYSKISSLREYVLAQQDEPSVQIYYRASDTDLWQITWVEDLSQSITLQSLSIEIPLQELSLHENREPVNIQSEIIVKK